MRFAPSLLVLSVPLAHAIPQLSQDSASVSAEYANDDTFEKAVLDVTNLYRRQHNASQLAWNESLVEYAKDWSEDCEFKHSGGPSGENLASGYPNVTASIEAWGNERDDYDFDKGEFASKTGHFTQLVWRNTSTVGCARTECNGSQKGGKGDAPGWYVVCEYYPTGNVIGQFTDNVLEQLPDDKVPSASDAPTTTGVPSATATPQGMASGTKTNMVTLFGAVLLGALWV
ncbi:PR-1-like protein [Macroventuria anomochaeta]|uniref:PR-1-like protein n=1 Tax=Macroventuria anomochaeta TaxID=301207 RepID=A0ACB6RTD2_9PLEO|nr:PR-1-like protein [Macroventuria anomochaeta]KAF2624398.1 PR-1-like protein [Macroventuria anomochaeta]